MGKYSITQSNPQVVFRCCHEPCQTRSCCQICHLSMEAWAPHRAVASQRCVRFALSCLSFLRCVVFFFFAILITISDWFNEQLYMPSQIGSQHQHGGIQQHSGIDGFQNITSLQELQQFFACSTSQAAIVYDALKKLSFRKALDDSTKDAGALGLLIVVSRHATATLSDVHSALAPMQKLFFCPSESISPLISLLS